MAAFAASALASRAPRAAGDAGERAIWAAILVGLPALVLLGSWIVSRHRIRRVTAELEDQLALERSVTERVSHEFRDRVTVIYGFSETLLDGDAADASEVREIVTVINSEAIDLGRIAEDLVSASQLRSDGLRLVHAGFDPALEVDRVVLPFARRGRSISVDCWSGTAFSDPIRFRQVVRTLVSNAVEHGGETIEVLGTLAEGTFACTVVDDGHGIDEDEAARLFGPDGGSRPFAQVQGTGLAVANAVAGRLGGRLTYERTEGVTRVTLLLPAEGWPGAVESKSSRPDGLFDQPDPPSSTAESVNRTASEQGGLADALLGADQGPESV